MASIVRRQHGVIARGQLLELGVGSGAIADRLRTRRLVRVHRGVYYSWRQVTGDAGRVRRLLAARLPGENLHNSTSV